MPVPTTLRGISATAGSNNPAGSEVIGSGLDDYLRAIQAVFRQYLASQASNIASASTTDLSTADGFYAAITGTTTINSFGTEGAGIPYLLKFNGAVQLNQSSAIQLPGAATFTTAAGDMAWVVSEGSGNWRIPLYMAKAGGIIGTTQTLAHSGDVMISKATPLLTVDGTGTTSSFVRLSRGGVSKWDIVNAGTTGDQFQITDTAVILLTVNRTTGNTAVTGSLVATGGLTANFTSAETAVGGTSTTTTVAHGLGTVPSHFEVVLRNKTTEFGYAVGDEVSISSITSTAAVTIWADATNVGITQFASAALVVTNRSTFAASSITSGNWKYVVRAWK